MFNVDPRMGETRAEGQVLAPHKVTDYAGAPLHRRWWTNARWLIDEQPFELGIVVCDLSA